MIFQPLIEADLFRSLLQKLRVLQIMLHIGEKPCIMSAGAYAFVSSYAHWEISLHPGLTVFDHCDMTGAVMTHSNLSGAVLQDCETENASLQNCLIKGMLLRDAGSATLNMVGTTIDEEAWSGQEPQALSEEELL